MMSSEVIHYHDKTTKDYCPTYGSHDPFINDEHASIWNLVESVPGKMWPEDALKLYEIAYFAEGPVLEIGGLEGKSTTILALAIQAAGRGVPLISIDPNRSRAEAAVEHAKRLAPGARCEFHVGPSEAILSHLNVEPAFVFVDGAHDYENVKTDLLSIDAKLRREGFLLLHDYYDRRNDDPNEPAYGVNRAALDVLNPHHYAFRGRFGCTALFQKTAVPQKAKTHLLRNTPSLGALGPVPHDETMLDAVVTSLVNYLGLPKYGIDWNDGERVIPEIWALHPKRRFTYYAHLAIYDFACRFAEGKRVLDVGGGVGYGDYYLVARGAREVVSLDVDEHSHRYARDRYRHERLHFYLGPIESLAEEDSAPFDFIICSNVMEHIADYPSALETVHRLLAPDGLYLQVTPPSGKARGNPYHVTNFTVPEWREILEPLFPHQRYIAHVPLRERTETNNQFDFRFEQCSPEEMHSLGSISGMIVCQRSPVLSPKQRFSFSEGDLSAVPRD